MTHAEFQGFCTQLDVLIGEAGDASIGIPASKLAVFRQNLELFTDYSKTTTASDITPSLQAADAERTRLYKGILRKLQGMQNFRSSSAEAVWPRVEHLILNVYDGSVASETMIGRSASLASFLTDLRKFSDAELQTLGIASRLTALETANQSFDALSVARAKQVASVPKAAAATVRTKLADCIEEMFRALSFWANTEYIPEIGDPQAESYPAAATAFIDSLNALISRVCRTARTESGTASGTTSGTTSETTESGNNGTTESSESTSGSTESSGTTGSETDQTGSGSTENTESGNSSESSENSGTSENTDNTNTGGSDDGNSGSDDGGDDDDDDDVFA